MLLKLLVIEVILRVPPAIPSIANVTSFVLFSAMSVELVVSIESLSTKTTFWMTLEARLVYSTWVIVSVSLVLPQLAESEQLVFVGEDFLIACAQIAHSLAVL